MARRVSAYAILMGFVSLCAFAAPPPAAAPQPEYYKNVGFAVSPPVRDLPAREGLEPLSPKRSKEAPVNPPLGRIRPNATIVSTPEAALPPFDAPDVMPPIITQFAGISSVDNIPIFGGQVLPPDTNHDVGPNHVVETVNLLVRIYDKAGTPAGPAFPMSDLFSGLGGVCANNDDGDPIVLYDQWADRWLISQFAFPSFPNPPFHQCVAISQTGDPTGAYFGYDFIVPNANLNDYPHFGVWPDAYYMTVNQFLAPGLSFNGTGAFAFERDRMLVGDPTAGMIYFNLSLATNPEGIGGTLPSDADGALAPPAGAPNVVAYFLATEFGDAMDGIRFFNFHVDWVTPGNSTFIERPGSPLAVAAFDPISPSGRADIPQPGTAARLDSIADRFMHRFQYRNFGTHESWVTNHTVDASGDPGAAVFRAGVRYYELRRNGLLASPITIHEQATHAPADTEHRWMGSAALDSDGNMAVGFSVSSGTVSPSIRYAGRLAGDPAGSLAQGEATMIAGSGSQTSSSSRWGDYSMMAVDPTDDCTFWYSQEYYAGGLSGANWLTRIGSFKYPTCSAPPTGAVEVNVTNCDTAADVQGAQVSMTPFFRTTDVNGQALITSVAAGNYTVNVSFPGYQPASGPAVVTNGNTTVVNVCLAPIAIVVQDEGTLEAEDCVPSNGVLDPGENVTVSLCVTNTGAAPTVNVIGTLQSGGGVFNPSGPQVYGAIAPGATVCQDFTFEVAAACGNEVNASVQFQDGAINYGTFSYDFQTGVLQQTFAQNFDGVVAPALPAGWTQTTAQDVGANSDPWATSTTTPDTAPNHAFTNDPNNISDERLDTPSIPIGSASAVLTFRNSFVMEDTFDGGVLEVSVGGGAFQDILAAGGSFVSGGYTDTISVNFGSPIGGRQAWSGNSGGYITTSVNLPASMDGQNVVFRFRRATDNSVAATGWRVDTVAIQGDYACCNTALSLVPTSLKVDERAAAGTTGNLDGVWTPGERVLVETGWTMTGPSSFDITGSTSNLIGPAGATYTLNDNAADFGTVDVGEETDCGTDCYQVSVDNPASRPAAPWAATVDESLNAVPSMPTGGGFNKTWSLHIGNSFLDAQQGSFGFKFIETLYKNGVTGGCGGGNFCPNSNIPREQMAVFLLVAKEGAGYTPPACTVPVFTDVPCSSVYAPWINELSARGITGGCGPNIFCPADPVSRETMAVFLLVTEEGTGYTPPACTVPVFTDVPCSSVYAPWINEINARGITGGCGPNIYCPTQSVTRAQMSVFITVTFGLVLYGP